MHELGAFAPAPCLTWNQPAAHCTQYEFTCLLLKPVGPKPSSHRSQMGTGAGVGCPYGVTGGVAMRWPQPVGHSHESPLPLSSSLATAFGSLQKRQVPLPAAAKPPSGQQGAQ